MFFFPVSSFSLCCFCDSLWIIRSHVINHHLSPPFGRKIFVDFLPTTFPANKSKSLGGGGGESDPFLLLDGDSSFNPAYYIPMILGILLVDLASVDQLDLN